MKNPLELFFSLSPKDPQKKAQYDYYLYWIVFLAFVSLGINYFRLFYLNAQFTYLGWGIVMIIISYFNYFVLVSFRNNLKMIKAIINRQIGQQNEKEESVEEMLNEFK